MTRPVHLGAKHATDSRWNSVGLPGSADRRQGAGFNARGTADRGLRHRDYRRLLRQHPEVEGTGCGWCNEILRPAIGLAVAGGRDQSCSRNDGTARRPREGCTGHRGRRRDRNLLHAAVRCNVCIVNLRGRRSPAARRDSGTLGFAGRDGRPGARTCRGVSGLNFHIDSDRAHQTDERVRIGDT